MRHAIFWHQLEKEKQAVSFQDQCDHGEDIEESGDFIVNEKEKVVNLTETV